MRQEQHPLVTFDHGILGHLFGDLGLAAAGRQRKQDMPRRTNHFALDVVDGLDLIIAQLGHAGLRATRRWLTSAAKRSSSRSELFGNLLIGASVKSVRQSVRPIRFSRQPMQRNSSMRPPLPGMTY